MSRALYWLFQAVRDCAGACSRTQRMVRSAIAALMARMAIQRAAA